MKDIRCNGRKFPVPSGWHECTIKMFADIQAVALSNVGNYHKSMQKLAIVTGIPEQIIRSASEVEIIDMLNALDFIHEMPEIKEPAGEIKIGTKVYTVPKKIGSVSFGQFVDFETVINMHPENTWACVPSVIAIYCRDYSKPYNADEMLERAKLAESCKAIEALSLAAFFLRSEDICRMTTESCTLIMAAQMGRKHTWENGRDKQGGLQRSTTLLKKICLKWMMSRMKTLQGLCISLYSPDVSNEPRSLIIRSKAQ